MGKHKAEAHKLKSNFNKEREFAESLNDFQQQLQELKRLTLLTAKKVLTIADVALLTGLSKSHLYKLTCAKEIPHYKPNGKLMYFDKGEVEAWMKQNRVNTTAEAEQAAAAYCARKGARV